MLRGGYSRETFPLNTSQATVPLNTWRLCFWSGSWRRRRWRPPCPAPHLCPVYKEYQKWGFKNADKCRESFNHRKIKTKRSTLHEEGVKNLRTCECKIWETPLEEIRECDPVHSAPFYSFLLMLPVHHTSSLLRNVRHLQYLNRRLHLQYLNRKVT